MKRRKAIVNLVMGASALASLPSWASRWQSSNYSGTKSAEIDLLGEVISGIIPEGETPGAQSLKVHYYINDLLEICYPIETKLSFIENLNNVDSWSKEKHGKNFGSLSQAQKEEFYHMLSTSEIPEEIEYMKILKRLTIEGYKRSEYFKNQIENYEMAPGYYHGCESL